MALSTIQNNSFADTAVHGFRNLIINGAMQIYQRGAGTLASGQFGPDRFEWGTANLDNLAGTLTQDSDAPDNFSSSLKITVTTAETSIASDEYAYLHQRIEAQNLQGLGYGTSSAKQVTLSFWVKSSVTGTFAVGLFKADNTAQIHNKTYTINSAGTWEYKTVTFSANTLSGGAIDNDNGIGLYVNWHLGAGSVFKGTSSSSGWISYVSSAWADGQDTDAVLTTTNATWQITGVQLELGSEPTPFEHRPYGDELARCQRYFERIGGYNYAPIGNGMQRETTQSHTQIYFKTTKRADPSHSYSNIITTDRYVFDQAITGVGQFQPSTYGAQIQYTHTAVGADRRPIFICAPPISTGYVDFDAEL